MFVNVCGIEAPKLTNRFLFRFYFYLNSDFIVYEKYCSAFILYSLYLCTHDRDISVSHINQHVHFKLFSPVSAKTNGQLSSAVPALRREITQPDNNIR